MSRATLRGVVGQHARLRQRRPAIRRAEPAGTNGRSRGRAVPELSRAPRRAHGRDGGRQQPCDAPRCAERRDLFFLPPGKRHLGQPQRRAAPRKRQRDARRVRRRHPQFSAARLQRTLGCTTAISSVSSGLCGSCHDVVNGHGTAIERTFIEWKATAFAAPNGRNHVWPVRTWIRSSEPTAIASVSGARCAVSGTATNFRGVDQALHDFPEADAQRQAVQTLLDTTLQTALCVRGAGKAASLEVVADNVASGHKWPSGAAQDRRAWVRSRGLRQRQRASITAVATCRAVTDPTALSDPDLWLVRDCMLDENGNAVDGLWDATSVDSNLLLRQLTFDKSSPLFLPKRTSHARSHMTRSRASPRTRIARR